MKKVICILLVFTFLLQYFSKVELLMYYVVNKQQIIGLFCINKDKPALHCDGKCYMKKQWKASEESEKKTPVNPVKSLNPVLFFEETGAENQPPVCHTATCFPDTKYPEHRIPGKGIFHPPRMA